MLNSIAAVLTALCLGLVSGQVASQPVSKAMAVTDLDSRHDYHSYANASEVRVTHLDMDLTVDFEHRKIEGIVTHSLKRQPGSEQLVLDTRGLNIVRVEQGARGSWTAAQFSMGESHEALGTPMTIALLPNSEQVRITYTTEPDAKGLDWLEPAQTAGKTQPFLYTQAQAIHARSFIPLQDSPAVRVTYEATIRTPSSMRAVMSAANDPRAPKTGVYRFSMPQPIPSYLIALAVGDIEFKAMGQRTGIYSEKVMVDAAAWEFADTESMLEAVEERYGAYAWGRYDLLILPPSFPWGGMENPRLSFITPTVVAGDRSLVSLIAHELAHSWSGNTVTNATWRDVWLNEGFTTYLTYRIMEDVYGVDRNNMERVLGYQDLQRDLATASPGDQRLTPDLRGRDPDDGFSRVPYQKGALMVTEMEMAVGREAFDDFLLQYFAHFAFQSITTQDFLDYVDVNLVQKYPDKLSMARLLQWIEQPGLPEGAPVPESGAFDAVDLERKAWLAGNISAKEITSGQWTVHEWRYFLNNMPERLSPERMLELDKAFKLTESSNSEILHSWLLIAIRNDYQPAWPALERYLTGIGRRKLIVPLYRALLKTDKGTVTAVAVYSQARPGYHGVARGTLDKLMPR